MTRSGDERRDGKAPGPDHHRRRRDDEQLWRSPRRSRATWLSRDAFVVGEPVQSSHRLRGRPRPACWRPAGGGTAARVGFATSCSHPAATARASRRPTARGWAWRHTTRGRVARPPTKAPQGRPGRHGPRATARPRRPGAQVECHPLQGLGTEREVTLRTACGGSSRRDHHGRSHQAVEHVGHRTLRPGAEQPLDARALGSSRSGSSRGDWTRGEYWGERESRSTSGRSRSSREQASGLRDGAGPPRRDPDDWDTDPIIEASELNAAGERGAARTF